ncbi:asparagine synthase-related protein [Massilia sp. LXY-6]|uniref:asparagine synthase-related protein n=1 Tax=Massilia sp. LXY-6 TaxID=3379823 RepID=UPI003EDE9C19
MTIFAGAYSLNPNDPLPAELTGQLRAAVSRCGRDTPSEHSASGFFALKVDIGAFGTPGEQADADGTTLVAGEPLLSDGEGAPEWNRSEDVRMLHQQLAQGGQDVLRRARGTFCGLHYAPARHRLTLFVDKMGVRPVYVWAGPRFVVFATALRVLESVALVPKQLDLRGVTELAAFAYPLADRTPYRDIAMLRAAQTVELEDGQVRRASYWRWDGPLAGVEYQQGVGIAYRAFIQAIERRHRDSKIAAAFLSGGLDSRVIVGGLRASGSTVHTVNYAPDGSQDQVFAELVAKRLGIHHTRIETNAANVHQGYRKDAVAAWLRQTFAGPEGRERAPLVWSGDGGSVAVGNVYMTPEIVSAMERGDTAQAIVLFNKGLPSRIFKRTSLGQVADLPFQGIEEELAAIDSPDPGRKFQLFLMFNDQRRHLAQHFEDIDVERIEFQLPFFDADFLDTVLRLPNDWLMAHRFYMDWLARFPNGLDQVPWQAYPGHVPCTLPSPPGLKYQWDVYYDKKMYAQMRRATAANGRKLLAAKRFPDHLISRNALRMANLLTGSGLRDYAYLIKTASVYCRYWEASTASTR